MSNYNPTEKNRLLLGLLSTDIAGQVDVFGQYGDTLSTYGTHVGVLQETHHVILSGLLICQDGVHLETQVMCPMLLCYLAHQTYKKLLTDEELSASLAPVYPIETHHPSLVPLGPLQPTL